MDSSDQLSIDVAKAAEKSRARAKHESKSDEDSRIYMKTPQVVDVPPRLAVSAGDVLRELGVATTFLTDSPFVPIAQLWAHVRYCATMEPGRSGLLSLTAHAHKEVVHHHKVAQSEQIGIGLALVVARAVMRQQHPGCVFQVVDADVALAAGFIDEVKGRVESRPQTKKRPDYFLIGRRPDAAAGRSTVYIAVLECKGTHFARAKVVKQLGDACLQVQTVSIGRNPLYGLMVGSSLNKSGITSYVLDPPGSDQLWEGDTDTLDALIQHEPDEPHWRPGQYEEPPDADGDGVPGPEAAGREDAEPEEPPAPYAVPPQRKGWLAQVLTRSHAAAVLLFAGDNATAAHYLTPRQRGHQQGTIPDSEQWPDYSQRAVKLPGGPRLHGTTVAMPLPGGQVLEIFRGMDERLYRDLAEGKLSTYGRHASRLQRWWRGHQRRPGDVLSVGADGTALLMRVRDRRDA